MLRLTLVTEDNPLYANEQQTVLNMVVENPRWTNGRMEANPPIFRLYAYTTCWKAWLNLTTIPILEAASPSKKERISEFSTFSYQGPVVES
jgi:hypothetical protein